MGDNKDSSGMILGLVIGAFIALMLFGRRSQAIPTPPVQSTQAVQPMQIIRDNVQQSESQYNWQPMDIPKVDDIKPLVIQQDPKLSQMEYQLQKATSQLEQATSKLQELQDTVSKLQQNNISQPSHVIQEQSIQSAQGQSIVQQPIVQQPVQEQRIYKNSEKWKIVRGKDGRIKSLDIARDVKKSN